jgi:4-hydroxy-2-oxoheptanedioate aldolase
VRPNLVKQKLKQGETVIGSFLYVPAAKLAELIGLCGFDFVVIDQEHGPLTIERVEECVRACELVGVTPLVRVGKLAPFPILQALDVGALGVHVPTVNTTAQAQEAMRACKYRPVGDRGLAGVRAANYGMREPLADYCKQANEETMVVIHIEEMTAIKNLEELVDLDGIDVYYLGPTDLSNSLGRPGVNDAELSRIVTNAIRTIVAAGKTAGMITNNQDDARRCLDMGVRYLATHAMGFMAESSKRFLQGVKEPR